MVSEEQELLVQEQDLHQTLVQVQLDLQIPTLTLILMDLAVRELLVQEMEVVIPVEMRVRVTATTVVTVHKGLLTENQSRQGVRQPKQLNLQNLLLQNLQSRQRLRRVKKNLLKERKKSLLNQLKKRVATLRLPGGEEDNLKLMIRQKPLLNFRGGFMFIVIY